MNNMNKTTKVHKIVLLFRFRFLINLFSMIGAYIVTYANRREESDELWGSGILENLMP